VIPHPAELARHPRFGGFDLRASFFWPGPGPGFERESEKRLDDFEAPPRLGPVLLANLDTSERPFACSRRLNWNYHWSEIMNR